MLTKVNINIKEKVKEEIKPGSVFIRRGGMYDNSVYVLATLEKGYNLIDVSSGERWTSTKPTLEELVEKISIGKNEFGYFEQVKNPQFTIEGEL